MNAQSTDVFLSYNSQDHVAVEAGARRLSAYGLTVFLDRWYLLPGRPWPRALEEILDACHSICIFLGPHGMGRWQQREKALALDRQTRDPAFPVIPVLLPGAAPALGFLSLNTWVDLRGGLDNPLALEILSGAVQGRPPGPDLRQRVSATWASVCPYRGLRFFREEDTPFFFGQDAFVERLVGAVERRALVGVVGASGSGKSSVVLAGLVPHLRRGARGSVWDAIAMVPGDRPLRNLAGALLPLLELELTETDQLAERRKLAEFLASEPDALRDVVGRILQKQPGTDRLLLVVDQWEELYTLARHEQEQRRFQEALLDAVAVAPLTVVLTLRGDFYGRALAYRPLSDRLQDAVVNLGPMTEPELQQAIEAPARKVGLTFEPGLVTRLLRDVKEQPGGLPLLEFVLTELWQQRQGGQLSHEAYERIGGLQGAIARRAEEVFTALTVAEQQTASGAMSVLNRPSSFLAAALLHRPWVWEDMAVLRQHLPSAPRCCLCATFLALAASCTLARVCTRLSRRPSAAPMRVPELKTAPHALMRLHPSLTRQPAAAWPCCCRLARLGVVPGGTGRATG